MLNILGKAHDVLNYGTSIRYGWLDDKGKELKAYLETKTVEDLYEIVMGEEKGE
jgi:hypothetical protein